MNDLNITKQCELAIFLLEDITHDVTVPLNSDQELADSLDDLNKIEASFRKDVETILQSRGMDAVEMATWKKLNAVINERRIYALKLLRASREFVTLEQPAFLN